MSLLGANRYWIATSAGSWTVPANWSTTSGGTGGASVPGLADVANFTSSANGTCTIPSNQTISGIVFSGYTGSFDLNGFTLTVSGTATASTFSSGTLANSGTVGSLAFNGAGAAVFNGMTINASITGNLLGVNFNGSTFNGAVSLTKNGTTSDTHSGGNTFKSTFTFVNNSSGTETFASVTGDNFSGVGADVEFTNLGAGGIYIATKGSSLFKGNVYVNSTNGLGVFFGVNGGISNVSNGNRIIVGGTGFSAGELRLLGFNIGAASVNITLTGTTVLRIGANSSFNGVNTWTAPSIYLDGATFYSFATFTKTGASNDVSVGGNNFQAGSSITNSGSGTITLSNVTGDLNHWATSYIQSPGVIQPAFNSTTIYQGNINVNSTVPIVFGAGSGIVSMQHISSQSFNNSGTATPTITRLVMNTSSGVSVTLNTPVNVTSSVTFTNGVIYSFSSSNYLNIANGATVSGASSSSYVDGPVRKTGNQAFTFPVGNNGIYRPITITAPSSATDAFTGQFFHSAQTSGNQSTYQLPILTVSSCEYWVLDRSAGTSNVSVTLGWNSTDCTGTYITDLSKLVVGRWNGTNWVSEGNGGTTGTTTSGTITSSGAVTSFSPFAIASSSLANPLPISLISFDAKLINGLVRLTWQTASEIDNDHFIVERSSDGSSFEQLGTVMSKSLGTSSTQNTYSFDDENPLPGVSYYRLKQVDLDKHEKILGVRMIENNGRDFQFVVYPNPVVSADDVSTNYNGPVQVVNVLGQVVAQLSNGSKISLAGLSSGIYIIRTNTGLSQKLIVK